ncbi:protein of unknown function [Rhodovastum atsumiense]|nr:protein of unknown function [Rhodovastum atsumiense]
MKAYRCGQFRHRGALWRRIVSQVNQLCCIRLHGADAQWRGRPPVMNPRVRSARPTQFLPAFRFEIEPTRRTATLPGKQADLARTDALSTTRQPWVHYPPSGLPSLATARTRQTRPYRSLKAFIRYGSFPPARLGSPHRRSKGYVVDP